MKQKTFVTTLLVIASSVFGFIGYIVFYMSGHGFHADGLDDLKPGMTKIEVEELMQEPIDLEPYDEESITYAAVLSSPLKFCSVIIIS